MKLEKLLELQKDYGPVPFWFWNGDLDKETLAVQMEEMIKQNVYEFIIHARKGLTIQYLSEEWFERIAFVIKKSKELGLRFWIYDEENWPSGYCGGRVIKENPDFCAKHLKQTETTIEALTSELIDKSISILIEQDNAYINILSTIHTYERSQKVLVYTMEYTKWHPAYFDGYYTDLLDDEATKTFMKFTHHEYEARFKPYLGTIIKGFFTDEPGFYQNLYMFPNREDINTIVWTTQFADYFNNHNGYRIESHLPNLWLNDKKSHQIKFDYYQTITKMVIENFYQPQREFCERYEMKLIGHVDFEDYLNMQINVQGDLTKVVGALSYAGVDKIDQNNEKLTEKLISSIGHMHQHERVLSETYALCGWGLDFQEMKRIADYQYVRGINLLNPHAFYYSIEEDRKWECPPSQFIQNPYWPFYHQFSNYITRLSHILSQGVHIADIAIYYPMPTAYDYYTPSEMDKVNQLDQLIQNVGFTLLENQYDFDFINDDVIVDAAIEDQFLVMHDEKFKVIVLPNVSTLQFEVAMKLKEFSCKGGILLILGQIPSKCIEVNQQDAFNSIMKSMMKEKYTYFLSEYALSKSYTYKFDIKKFDIIYHKVMDQSNFEKMDPHLDIALFDLQYYQDLQKDVHLTQADSHIKYLHRRIEEFDVYYFINEDATPRYNQALIRTQGLLMEIDLLNGNSCNYINESHNNYLKFNLELPEHGSRLFIIDRNQSYETYKAEEHLETRIFPIHHNWKIELNHQKFVSDLKNWEELGLPFYSGEAIYDKELNISNELFNYNTIFVHINDFRDCLELSINGQLIGNKIWAPYEFNIKKYLLVGKNTLKIRVMNTLFNEFEQKPRQSGLTHIYMRFCK